MECVCNVDWKSVKSQLVSQWRFISTFKNLPELSFYLLQFATVMCVYLILYYWSDGLIIVPCVNVLRIKTKLFKYSITILICVFVVNNSHIT